jgi:transitional endoplasmic reticulum ATPase
VIEKAKTAQSPAETRPTEHSFRVAEAPSRDVGRGLVRLDPKDMAALNVETGDVVAIRGKRATVARVMPSPPSERAQGQIQMDGILRTNAGVSLDQHVSLQRAAAMPARLVVLEPDRAAAEAPRAHRRYVARLVQGLCASIPSAAISMATKSPRPIQPAPW